MSHPAVPVIVGVAQQTNRPRSVDDFIPPFDFMSGVVRAAAEDAGAPVLVREADSLHVVNMLSYWPADAPRALAEKLEINPSTREYTAISGSFPQWLVNRACDRLAAGESRITILTGCEVMRSATLAFRAGQGQQFIPVPIEVEMVGRDEHGSSAIEQEHFADHPTRVYPMLASALRMAEGQSLADERRVLGRWGEAFSAVAARNPYAWFPVARSAEEIVTVTPDNRLVGSPYTKYLNAVMAVDQAAALILTTTEHAARLGIPRERWVYPWAGQDAADIWYVSNRPELADSPAIRSMVGDVLAQAGVGLDDVDFFDLYSCFHCMVRIAERALGIDGDDPRPRTLTGGLPYFGGAGCNYTMHALAEAVARCRQHPEQLGLVTANGWFCTKHSAGLYSAREPARRWRRTPSEEFRRQMAQPTPVEVDPAPQGALTVDAYTVWHDPAGVPEVGIVLGRTASGRRAWAQTRREDKALLAAMTQEEFVGRTGRISGREGEVNLIEFA
ncbi:MAG: acetyl-CoA acetyltransferase [Pirellulales bacterium]